MDKESLEAILSEVDVPLEDRRFYSQAYLAAYRHRKREKGYKTDLLIRVMTKEQVKLSMRLDQSLLQESCSVRNHLKTRRLASILIDEEGKFQTGLLSQAIQLLEGSLYALGPDRQHDARRQEHLLNVLKLLAENPALIRKLKAISRPEMHRIADQIIRETLQLPSKVVVSDAHTRRAVLAAWMCYLRQNVGSCFATAPAVIVQREQPELFLRDMQELLATGRLKRVFGGVEYTVPLSYGWGAGDLRRVFVFSSDPTFESPGIWNSPGFIRALSAIGIIEEEASTSEKQEILKELIAFELKNWDTNQEWFYTTVEEILRKILLTHYSILQEEVDEFLNRPKAMIHDSLMMHVARGSKPSGKTDRVQLFISQFENAKTMFKSFSDNALLKTWEFTLASFSETKAQFTTWNLYSSLGLRAEDKGGIGPCLYEILNQRLHESNEKAEQFQIEYEQLYNQVQVIQRRSRNVGSEKEAQWVRIEYQSKSSEMRTVEVLRNEWHMKARRYSHLYDGLIDLYFRLFSQYFQEVYDPDINEVTSGPFDDSPAGFRLLYKHGRSNTSQWTPIHNHTEFVEALSNFFTASERELISSPEMQGIENDLSEITTRIVTHVRSQEFIETAFYRMAQKHGAPMIKDPLENLDKIQKKPWVYTSGGAITTLISCYFRLDEKPKEVSRWVESPMELLVFLIDSVKEISENTLDDFVENNDKSLLVHSPTHAFLLKPGYQRFRSAWKDPEYTYSWVRDFVVKPAEHFVNNLYLNDEYMKFVVDVLLDKVHPNIKHYFRQTFYALGGSMNVVDFRNHMLNTIEVSRGLQYMGRGCVSADEIDGTFFSLLPLFSSYKLKDRVEVILNRLPGIDENKKSEMLTLVERLGGKVGAPRIMGADSLQEIVKSLIAIVTHKTAAPYDYPLLISQICQDRGYAMPAPFVFADTNWVKDYFSFLVNPGSGKFELWRTDYIGSIGEPMRDWDKWLDGSRKKPDWGVFNRPYEYRLDL